MAWIASLQCHVAGLRNDPHVTAPRRQMVLLSVLLLATLGRHGILIVQAILLPLLGLLQVLEHPILESIAKLLRMQPFASCCRLPNSCIIIGVFAL